MKHLTFFASHVEINIESGKTDVYRRGNSIVIAKTSTDLCPVKWLLKYIDLAELSYNSDDFIFRSIRFLKSSNTYKLINVRCRTLALDNFC